MMRGREGVCPKSGRQKPNLRSAATNLITRHPKPMLMNIPPFENPQSLIVLGSVVVKRTARVWNILRQVCVSAVSAAQLRGGGTKDNAGNRLPFAASLGLLNARAFAPALLPLPFLPADA